MPKAPLLIGGGLHPCMFCITIASPAQGFGDSSLQPSLMLNANAVVAALVMLREEEAISSVSVEP